jgi:hypothetical protein
MRVDQQVHDVRPLGEIPRPIRDDMECGAAASSGYEPRPCEIRVVSNETPYGVKITAPDHSDYPRAGVDVRIVRGPARSKGFVPVSSQPICGTDIPDTTTVAVS